MKAMTVFLLATLAGAGAAHCADGFSVAMIDKGTKEFNDEVVKFIIQNNTVSASVVLFTGKCGGRDARPVISFDGTKVAFAGRREGEQESAIFVVDSNGENLKRLVTPAYGGCTERHKVLDWPAGPYIYYKKSKTEMYRVNSNDPSDNGLAVTVPIKAVERYNRVDNLRFRKWSVSADVKRSAVQWEMYNVITNFPLDKARMEEPVGGCNIHLSAGGNYYCYLSDAGHVKIHLSRWESGSYTTTKIGSWHNDDMSKWAGTKIGKGMDWPRWSTNSDKWMCLQVGRQCPTDKGLGGRFCGCGSNQVLFNWKDKQAIMTTNEPDGGRWVGAGDMWIRPPEGITHAYQTAAGQWVAVDDGSSSAISLPSVTPPTAGGTIPPVTAWDSHGSVSVRISRSGSHLLRVLRIDGTCIANRCGRGNTRYSFGKEIGHGVFIVRAEIGKKIYTRTVIVR